MLALVITLSLTLATALLIPFRRTALVPALAGLFLALVLAVPSAAADPGGADQQVIRELLGKVADREQRRMLLDEIRSGRLSSEELRQKVDPSPAAPTSDVAPSQVAPASHALGAVLSADKRSTTFRLFAPRATKVTLNTYAAATGAGQPHAMTRLSDGSWEAVEDGTGAGTFYDFNVDGPVGPGEHFDARTPVSDPCARANVNSDGRSIVVDDSFDWGRSANFRSPAQKDAVVYEMHLKDYSFHPSSGVTAPGERGKFLGLTRGAGSGKVLGNLVELGVNVAEILPVHEFDNNAAPPGHINHWGYMTTHYFAPESTYSSDSLHASGVREFKSAVKAMHEAGIAVVLDVVFNHTAEGNEQGPTFNLKGIDNKLYYRLTPSFYYWNGTGCGNELATENPAVRKLVVDSCRYWMDQYKVDGFRFDLGAGIDKDTMLALKDQLKPGTMLFAEPWTADWNRRCWDKGDLRGTPWGLWNDGYRKAVRDLTKGRTTRNDLMTAIAGSCMWFAATPAQSVNFVECHDNDALDDYLGHDVRRNHLAAVALLTAQGVPMLHEGQEFRKNKKGNDNSYDQDNDVNWIDWDVKAKNKDTFALYSNLIRLRRANGAFRQEGCVDDQHIKWFRPDDEQALGYLLRGPGNEPDYLVLLNGDQSNWVPFQLPGSGDWEIVCNGDAAVSQGNLGTARGDYKVAPATGVILRAPDKAAWR
ncbi:MAG: hypothetical protein HY303_01215 [Candidatus Wallbacteria bacterium]|nr:hypothetical protein [Candidatus Wallbacteria bacterium]